MEQTYEIVYNISIEDATPRDKNYSPARGSDFRHTQVFTTPERPPLEHIIEWINSKAEAIRDAIKEMLQNPGTKILILHSRFPLGTRGQEKAFHITLPPVTVDALAIERIKAKVIETYESA